MDSATYLQRRVRRGSLIEISWSADAAGVQRIAGGGERSLRKTCLVTARSQFPEELEREIGKGVRRAKVGVREIREGVVTICGRRGLQETYKEVLVTEEDGFR